MRPAPLALFVLTTLVALWACGGPQCPTGQQYVCQSGPKYGTQCACVPTH